MGLLIFAVALLFSCGVESVNVDQEARFASSCLHGQLQQVKQLLADGVPADHRSYHSGGSTCLLIAVMHNNVPMVELMLQNGADIDFRGPKFGSSALHAANSVGNLKMMKLLIKKGASLERKDYDGNTPLILSVWSSFLPKDMRGNPDLVAVMKTRKSIPDADKAKAMKILLDAGANMYATNRRREINVMFMAALEGNTLAMKMLMDAGFKKNTTNFYKWTALHFAAWSSQPAAVKLLLRNGYVVDARGMDKKTPLMVTGLSDAARHEAGVKNAMVIIAELKRKGADINAVNSEGQTTLMMAMTGSWTGIPLDRRIWKFYMSNEIGCDVNIADHKLLTALFLAVNADDAHMVERLVNAGAKVDVKDGINGQTPLIWAAWKGNVKIVKTLLEKRADVQIADKHGRTALLLASWQGFTHVAKLLLNAGAKFDTVDVNGWTALMFAVKNNAVKLMKMLLKLKVNVNVVNKSHQSALTFAAEVGDIGVIKMLLDRGADVNVGVGTMALTPLMLAARSNHLDAMEMLIKAGADINAKRSESHETALMFAAKHPDGAAAKLLMKHKADALVEVVSHGENTGITALTLAKTFGNKWLI